MQPAITLASGSTTDPFFVQPDGWVIIEAGSASATLQYTTGTPSDIANGTATWVTAGTYTGFTAIRADEELADTWVKLTAASGSITYHAEGELSKTDRLTIRGYKKTSINSVAPAYALDKDGNVTGLVGPGKAFTFAQKQTVDYASRFLGGIPITAAPTSGLTVSGTGVTSQYTVVDGYEVLQVTTGVGNFAEIAFPTFSSTVTNGQMHVVVKIPDVTTVSNITPYIGDAGYTNFYNAAYTVHGIAGNSYTGYHTLSPLKPATPADTNRYEWILGAGTPAFGTTTFTAGKIRINPVAGTSATVYFVGAWIGAKATLPKIAVTFDDGFLNAYTNGLPLLNKYNIKASWYIIGDFIGSANYMTLANLQDLYSRGHELSPHGPIGGAGSLANYTTYAQIYADVKYQQDYIVNNKLASNGSQYIYAYPQGIFALSENDTTIQSVLSNLGFVGARTVANAKRPMLRNPWAASRAMYLHNCGHLYAAGTEATNVSQVIATMQDAVAAGKDCVIMLHEVLTTTPSTTTQIQNTNLDLILAAINALEAAGTARSATMTEVVASYLGAPYLLT